MSTPTDIDRASKMDTLTKALALVQYAPGNDAARMRDRIWQAMADVNIGWISVATECVLVDAERLIGGAP